MCRCSPWTNSPFNPRPPWGGRRRQEPHGLKHWNFNPRPPWGGRLYSQLLGGKGAAVFQSTPSVGRATHVILKMGSHTKISIHALRGEGDDQKSKEAIKTNISIHALRGEGDRESNSETKDISHFNPRPPWGGRQLSNFLIFEKYLFQSTPSVGRATYYALVSDKTLHISIHALRGEGDKNKQSLKITPPKFQSTPSVGRATRAHAALDRESAQFQSTPSVGRATI